VQPITHLKTLYFNDVLSQNLMCSVTRMLSHSLFDGAIFVKNNSCI
jgi:hypothetical protein